MTRRVVPVLLLLVGACSSKDSDPPKPGTGLFVTGCPRTNRARAEKIERPDQRATGPDVIGGVGDYVLMNEKAAFVIQGPGATKTYWPHGGILVDAVAVNDCAQATPERFSELGILFGKLKINDFTASTLRSFRAERLEVVSDGSDGKAAVVRAHGVDDYFWLVELTLVREAYASGKKRPLSQRMPIEFWVDYVLAPGSQVLQIELNMKNTSAEFQQMLAGAALFTSDTTPVSTYSGALLTLGGFNVRTKVPWILAGAGDGSIAVAIAGGNMGTVNISGVDAVINVDQVVSPINLSSGGGTGVMRYFVSVGPRDGNSAVHALEPFMQEGRSYRMTSVSGRVLDPAGAPLANVQVDVELPTQNGGWEPLDSLHTAADGSFSGRIADFLDDNDPDYRLVVRSPNRALPAPHVFKPSLGATGIDLMLGPPARLAWTVKDETGQIIPAKVSIFRDDRLVRHEYSDGTDETLLPPGTYSIMVTRGFEYALHEQMLELPAAGATLDVMLPHVVDTTGWLSLDTHVHASPSADSSVMLPRRALTAAAAGLEVMVGTDHEIVSDWAPAVREAGVEAWVRTVIGEEVTATIPEHTNMFPVPLGADDGIRGRIVPWYGLGVAEIYNAERARGAGVVQLNHPKDGGYMSLIEWDRVTGLPKLDDPTAIGLNAGTALWSWNFDTIEYQNGYKYVFVQRGRERETGLFDDWLNFYNLGKRVTGLGVTDTHNDDIGSPMSYFASTTDKPNELDERNLVSAMKEGRVMVSVGAFARVSANGTGRIGDVVTDRDGMVDLAVKVQSLTQIDVTHFKVFVNCDEVLNIPTRTPSAVTKHDETLQLPITRDATVVVVGFGTKRFPRALDQFDPTGVPRFTTNPIFIDLDGNGMYDPPGGKTCDYDLNPP